MKQICVLLLVPIILVMSCGSEPTKVEQTPVETSPPVVAVQPATPVVPAPEPVQSTPPQTVPEPEPAPKTVESAPPPEKVFDPATITEEKFTITKADVNALIENLNKIIRARNYNAWVGYLADSYFEEISSRAFLTEKTEELYKRDQTVASNMGRDPKRVQKKILRTPKDYFDNVVVPSRSNDRMDDIAFVSDNRVKAYTVDTRGQRLILYDLENIENKWKIIN